MTRAKWDARPLRLAVVCALIVSLCATSVPSGTAQAACPGTLTVSITQHNWLLVDSNKPGVEGPMVTMTHATVTNTGASTVEDVYVYIGNGTHPGVFNPGTDGQRLALPKLRMLGSRRSTATLL